MTMSRGERGKEGDHLMYNHLADQSPAALRSLLFVISIFTITLLASVDGSCAPGKTQNDAPRSWMISLEEPTGIYRRDNEVVTVRLNFKPGEARKERLRLIAPNGREIVSQIE